MRHSVSKYMRDGEWTGRWRVRFQSAPGATWESKIVDRKNDGLDWVAERRGEVQKNEYITVETRSMTLRTFVESGLASTIDLKPTSVFNLDNAVRVHILPALGDVPLDKLTHARVQKFIDDLATRRSASTTRQTLAWFQRVLRQAVDAKVVRTNVAHSVRRPAETDGSLRFLTAAEVMKLSLEIHERYRAMILVAGWGGLRLGEMIGLDRRYVDYKTGTVRVEQTAPLAGGHIVMGPPKSKAGRRTVHLPRFVADELANHLGSHQSKWVFPSLDGSQLYHSNFRNRYFMPAVARAGLEPLRIHDLRHTAVSLWIAAGWSPSQICRQAGHHSPGFTLSKYGHLFTDWGTDAAKQLDRYADEN